jgi:hypothetical protein
MAVYHGGVVKQAEGDSSSMNRGEGEMVSTVAPDRSLGSLARFRFEAVPESGGQNFQGWMSTEEELLSEHTLPTNPPGSRTIDWG